MALTMPTANPGVQYSDFEGALGIYHLNRRKTTLMDSDWIEMKLENWYLRTLV